LNIDYNSERLHAAKLSNDTLTFGKPFRSSAIVQKSSRLSHAYDSEIASTVFQTCHLNIEFISGES
jgi:hypothetical protein